METRVSRAMERSTTDIELTFAKAERGNRQDCTDKGRGMGGTAEEGNKEAAWKYLEMIGLDYGCVIISNGKAAHWYEMLRSPNHWVAGCIAV